MKEPELTCEAREAVRSYMMKLVAIPGVFAAILSFLLGYGIRDIAARSAELQASQQLSNAIASALAKSQSAEEKLKEAEALTAKIKNIEALTTALSETDVLRKTLAEQLKADGQLRQTISGFT